MGLAAFNRMRREAAEREKAGNTSPPQTPDPHKLGVNELKAELAARQIDVPQGAKKAELLALLEAALKEGGGND